ncbi:MAG TPA: WYL domain-containing protein [Polyangiaceae bacterium]|nr:WYL domain-containing protein [Polyangiaceae bacterium]
MVRSANAANVEAIERAIVAKRRLRLKYRAASTRATTWRDVDPAALRLADSELYLVGWDLGKEDWRIFKVARVEVAQLRDEPSEPHGVFDEARLFENSVRVWVADPVDVVVRLTPEVAHLVEEYPLHPNQRATKAPDGGVVVRARVAGTLEALRWVLGWGRAAEALEPSAFRLLVAEELRAAVKPYGRGLSKKSTPDPVSRGVRRNPATTERGRSPKAEPSP